jgi:hypothetical protein
MSRADKIVTSQIDGNTGARNEPNTYSYDSDGILVRSDSDRVGKSVVGPGVLYGANKDSADQSGLNTIKLIPNEDLNTDQYLVIEPTGPNHIHIRAGGTQDDSNAALIIGGERNNVYIEDSVRKVSISTRPATVENTYTNTMESNGTEMLVPDSANITEGTTVNVDGIEYEVTTFEADPLNTGFSIVAATGASFIAGESYTFSYEESWNNYWEFGSDGVLYGPSMGGLIVNGLTASAGTDLYIYASQDQDVFISNDDTQALVGYRYLPQVDRSSDFTLELSHMGKHIYNTVDGQIEVTIPTNANVPFPIGTEIKLVNDSTASMLITRENTDTMILIAEGQGYTNEDIVFWLPSNGLATLFKVATNKWILSGLRVND